MTLDYGALLHDPNYLIHGVVATVFPSGSGAGLAVTAIDRTSGLQIAQNGGQYLAHPVNGGDFIINTIRPIAIVRLRELTDGGINVEDLDDGEIELNGKTWRIESHVLRPSPEGEAAGEVMLILSDENV